MAPQLIINNLSKSYGRKIVLDHVSCNYTSEMIHGVIGENGSGKSTFFNCISGNLPFQGEIIIEKGVRMGYLPTELHMYPRITGMEFIRFCLSAKGLKSEPEQIKKLNGIFELSLNEYAETYSTGMLKKLYLLTLILEKNNILLLDEPFNGLDVTAVEYTTELLLHLKNKGTLILISSHIVDHLYSFCGTLSLIENKKLQFIDEKEEFHQIKTHIKQQSLNKMKLLDTI